MSLRAFLAMPFRPDLQWVREAIRHACAELRVDLIAVDEQLAPGDEIVPAIRHAIRECSLAFAVLIDLNPNVMYELGLLHEASKPTILLGDPEAIASLPFDLRTRMVLTFQANAEAAHDLTTALIAATGRVLALHNRATRREASLQPTPSSIESLRGVHTSLAHFDWEKIRRDGATIVGRQGCETVNVSPHDDQAFRGWRLKARCIGGDTIVVYVDLNGDIVTVDVR